MSLHRYQHQRLSTQTKQQQQSKKRDRQESAPKGSNFCTPKCQLEIYREDLGSVIGIGEKSYMSDEYLGETMTLPIEGAAALRQILGILTDHEIEDADGRLDALDQRLSLAWNGEEWASMVATERGIPMSRRDAELLVRGLRFTEMMSTHLPFFDQVCAVSDWIVSELNEVFPGVSDG